MKNKSSAITHPLAKGTRVELSGGVYEGKATVVESSKGAFTGLPGYFVETDEPANTFHGKYKYFAHMAEIVGRVHE